MHAYMHRSTGARARAHTHTHTNTYLACSAGATTGARTGDGGPLIQETTEGIACQRPPTMTLRLRTLRCRAGAQFHVTIDGRRPRKHPASTLMSWPRRRWIGLTATIGRSLATESGLVWPSVVTLLGFNTRLKHHRTHLYKSELSWCVLSPADETLVW